MSKADNIKIALCQMNIVVDKTKNIEHAIECIRKCVKEQKARIVILPETFSCPYDTNFFADNAEIIPDGYTSKKLSALAKELQIYIVGGSIIEKGENNKYYNTSTVWSPNGELIGKHRKLHPFDVNIPECPFKESNVVTPGDEFTIVTMDGRKFGIGVCNDYRFEELAKIYRKKGVDMIIYTFEIPICQSMYWDVLLRARAADNQIYVAAVSSARNEEITFVAYGHSMVVDPYAKVCCEASEKEECLVCDIDFTKVDKIREEVPLFKQRRTDLYDTVVKKN